MRTKIRFLAATLLAAGAATAMAQSTSEKDDGQREARPRHAEHVKHEPLTRERALAKAGERFDALDLDKDGALSREELRAEHKLRRERSEAYRERAKERRDEKAERADSPRLPKPVCVVE